MSQPNYEHRTYLGMASKSGDFNDSDLVNCVSETVDQATSVLMQMETQFVEGSGTVNDSDNFATLEVIRNQLEDIRVVVNWYFDKSKNEVQQ